jgi:hypothetical protein
MASFNRQHVKAIASGFIIGGIFWFMGVAAKIIMPALPVVLEYGTFLMGFSAAIAVTYSEAAPPGEFKNAG